MNVKQLLQSLSVSSPCDTTAEKKIMWYRILLLLDFEINSNNIVDKESRKKRRQYDPKADIYFIKATRDYGLIIVVQLLWEVL
jgi:hypothetical protein